MTTSAIFPWTITYPDSTNTSVPYIPYRGTNFDACDVSVLGIEANALSATVGLSANVLCSSAALPILMRTSVKPWGGLDSFYGTSFEQGARKSYLVGIDAAHAL